MNFWKQEAEAQGPLTEEDFWRTVKKIHDAPPPPPHGTIDNPHIVSRGSYERGYGRCVQCGAWVSNASQN